MFLQEVWKPFLKQKHNFSIGYLFMSRFLFQGEVSSIQHFYLILWLIVSDAVSLTVTKPEFKQIKVYIIHSSLKTILKNWIVTTIIIKYIIQTIAMFKLHVNFLKLLYTSEINNFILAHSS